MSGLGLLSRKVHPRHGAPSSTSLKGFIPKDRTTRAGRDDTSSPDGKHHVTLTAVTTMNPPSIGYPGFITRHGVITNAESPEARGLTYRPAHVEYLRAGSQAPLCDVRDYRSQVRDRTHTKLGLYSPEVLPWNCKGDYTLKEAPYSPF